ncbi:MAG TPA: PSD1 and planctomycete cytochrome C domain-containing protein [Tepidisphaeraceae bacterium]
MTATRIALCALLLLLTLPARADPSPADRHFLDKVKPLLDSRCVSCHGPDKQKGSLRLDSRAATLKGGDSGPGVVPGKPADSLILQAVTHARQDLKEMPPKEKLTAKDIAVLERWIRDGAPWPETQIAAATTQSTPAPVQHIGNAWSDPRNPIVKIFGGQRLDLWSVKPIQRTEPPAVQTRGWARNPIDNFILARLQASGLQHAGPADKRTLIRRLSFDLIGLPPTPQELDAFLSDTSPDAYDRLVDRLLNSPRYGEHWARQWLDVIRYSDSNGFDWDEFRKDAWRFRDYVIRSLNADKPFDQFVREQLAGDELLDGPPRTPAEQDRLIATGYLRLGPHDNSAPLFGEQARSRAELMTDLVDTTGSAFLGLTMACCRCHDHKYDPLAQADYYRMRAFFEPVKFADDVSIDLASEQESVRKHNDAIDAQVKPLQQQRDALLNDAKERLRKERIAKLSHEEQELLNLPQDKRTGDLKGKFDRIKKKIDPDEKDALAALAPDAKARHKELGKQIEDLKKQKRSFTHALLMTDNADGKPPVTKILFQGDYRQERQPVQPGFISILDPNPAAIRKPTNPKTTGRRLALANWIVSPENPLTARVLVNRIWQGHFGRGLVSTPNDFGLAGARPTHPELLDWLASETIRDGWSLKKLHRLIVTSATYRQSSGVGSAQTAATTDPMKLDAEDELLWHYPLHRLSAEQLRDSLLAVSGLLRERDGGGPPVWPELPADVLTANPALLDDNAEKTKGWYPSPPAQRNCRGVYLVQKRTVRIPFMETFDLPENSTSCPRRNQSTVAPQALSLMNGPLAIQAAKAFAQRVEQQTPDPLAQVKTAFALAFQRDPDPDEARACLALLKSRSLPELCRALLNVNEFLYVD